MTHSHTPSQEDWAELLTQNEADNARFAQVSKVNDAMLELRWAPAALMFMVYGTPVQQGSKTGFVLKNTNRARIVDQNAKTLKPWREDVKNSAIKAMGSPLMINEPVQVELHFTLKKPASAPKKLRTFPRRTPDLDKLIRSTLDSLTDAGVWHDDAQVVSVISAKHYPGETVGALSAPGVQVFVRRLVDPIREQSKLA